jgi:hypothetical protein
MNRWHLYRRRLRFGLRAECESITRKRKKRKSDEKK